MIFQRIVKVIPVTQVQVKRRTSHERTKLQFESIQTGITPLFSQNISLKFEFRSTNTFYPSAAIQSDKLS